MDPNALRKQIVLDLVLCPAKRKSKDLRLQLLCLKDFVIKYL